MKYYKTYLAGAMQSLIDKDEGLSWRLKVKNKLEDRLNSDEIKLTTIIPNDFFNFRMDRDSYTYKEIYKWELMQVKQSNFIIVNLNYHGSQGTSHELAIACENNIPVIALIHESEIENAHPFDLECVDKVCNTVDELVDYINHYYLF